MTHLWKSLAAFIFASAITTAYADVTIDMHVLNSNGHGTSVGTITASDTTHGLLLTPNLFSLPPGKHGFHVHTNPSCGDVGMAAGGHLDPFHTGKHLGPYNKNGHLGDLPPIFVDKDGKATQPVVAPRLKVADIENHSLMIHVGGDNFSDKPPLGGGGMRMVCGVVK